MEKLVIENGAFFAAVIPELEAGREVTIPVKGYSMLPFIRGGKDLVVLKRGNYAPGDIVLFDVGGRHILHRLLKMENGQAEIMGDGVIRGREHCTADHIYGKVVMILKGGKRPVDPASPRQRKRSERWLRLLPYRRILLILWRLLPWNFWIVMEQRGWLRNQSGRMPAPRV